MIGLREQAQDNSQMGYWIIVTVIAKLYSSTSRETKQRRFGHDDAKSQLNRNGFQVHVEMRQRKSKKVKLQTTYSRKKDQ